MQKGQQDDATNFPVGQHSAVWVDAAGQVVCRFAQRKNRPKGSMLMRPCTCSDTGKRRCVAHRLQKLLVTRQLRQQIFHRNARQLLDDCRQLLVAAGLHQAALFTLRGFRAGKATAMLAAGKTLPHVMNAGQWRSAAALTYFDEGQIDAVTWMASELDKENDND